MGNHVRQTEFLCRLQECIDRFQPRLESEFGVSLGPVRAKRLLVRELIRHCFEEATELQRLAAIHQHGRPPTRWQRALLAAEKAVAWMPAYVWLSVRFGFPGLRMKWIDDPPAVAVFLWGWSDADYRNNVRRLSQWTVHELAHGVWSRIAGDRHQDHGRPWRIWNEGFAHYLADVHYRAAHPDPVIDGDWSADRLRGRGLVSVAKRPHQKPPSQALSRMAAKKTRNGLSSSRIDEIESFTASDVPTAAAAKRNERVVCLSRARSIS